MKHIRNLVGSGDNFKKKICCYNFPPEKLSMMNLLKL